ncbi:hypothetical protein LCGC14_3117190 [marine sediment metagenome]|uniref:Uncharacterized protein n=1 Tax=marine sediment metagenome TaxID=412755 RepID=A0A0F8W3Q2_9ZZZZ
MSQPQKPKLNARQVEALRKIAKMDDSFWLSWVYVHNQTGQSLERRGLVVSRYFSRTRPNRYKYSMRQAGRDYLDAVADKEPE